MTEGLIVWEELLVPAAPCGPWEPWTGPFPRKRLHFPPRPCHIAQVGHVWLGSSPGRREADPLWGPLLPPPPQAGRGSQGSRTPCFWCGVQAPHRGGFSCWSTGSRARGSVVAAPGSGAWALQLWHKGLVALQRVASSQPGDRIRALCFERRTFNTGPPRKP